ncbi:MAG: hypothetical protein JSR77_14225 [Planctomycetes bacterium]|nr:hypothetical protein [Planctomycetota bacterium]
MRVVTAAVTVLVCAAACHAQTAFTYQGELNDGGVPASGLHDFRFRLYSPVGVQLGSTLCADNVAVDGGRFTVQLDFGAQFSATTPLLEIETRADTGRGCGDLGGFVILSPRQPVTAAPKATHALTADALGGQAPAFYLNAANLTGVLGISQGGTGAAAAATARANLGVPGLLTFNTFNATQSFLLSGDSIGLIVRPAAGAASDLQQWRNSANTTVTRMSSAGALISSAVVQAAGFTFTSPVTRTMAVSPAQFSPSYAGFDYDNNGSRVRGLTSGQTCAFVGGLNLPDGATINAVRFHVRDEGTGTATLIMYRQSLTSTASFTQLANVASSGEVVGIRVFSDTVIDQPLVDNTQYQYHLYMYFTTPTPANTLDVWGVRIEYTIPGL